MTIQEFVAALNAKFATIEGFAGYTFTADKPGARFIRIVAASHGSRHVYCFVDRETGDILKAAGWKTPAKGVRSSLATVDMAKVDAYGSWLYIVR